MQRLRPLLAARLEELAGGSRGARVLPIPSPDPQPPCLFTVAQAHWPWEGLVQAPSQVGLAATVEWEAVGCVWGGARGQRGVGWCSSQAFGSDLEGQLVLGPN